MAEGYKSIFDAGTDEPPKPTTGTYQSIFDAGPKEAEPVESPAAGSWGQAAWDVAKQIPSGLVAGLGHATGAVPSLLGMAGHGVEAGIRALGLESPEQAEQIRQREELGRVVDEEIRRHPYSPLALSKVLPEPETTSGKYARTAGEFLAGNPLSYLTGAGVARTALTNTAAGLGSEAGGQLTEGWGPLETFGRVLGGMMAGHVPNAANKAVTNYALRNAATADDLANASGNLYERAYPSGVSVKPETGSRWAYDITSELRKEGFRPYTPATEAAFKTIGELAQPESLNQVGTLGIPEIDVIRKALNKINGGTDKEARAIARYGISRIDENIAALHKNPEWLATGHQNAEQVAKDITGARELYAAKMRSDMLVDAFDSALERAGRRTGSTGKGGNFENVMRQEIRRIVDSRVKRRGFNNEELGVLSDIAEGTTKRNLLRGISALAPTGIVSGTLGLEIGHLLFGGTKAMFGLPMVGYAAKKMAESQTRNAIEEAAARTRLRGWGGPKPQPYTPARGYAVPLINSAVMEDHSPYAKGGAVKATKTKANYRGGTKAAHCSICTMFRPPSSCTAVRGQISPHGWCKFFQHVPERADGGKITTKYDVVSGAVEDTKTGEVEEDRHIPEGDRKHIAAHERAEAKAMARGVPYKRAHEKYGIPAERRSVERAGKNWKEYTERIAGVLSHVEHEHVCRAPRHPHVDPRKAVDA